MKNRKYTKIRRDKRKKGTQEGATNKRTLEGTASITYPRHHY